MDWKQILEPLIKKLNPIRGMISHRISNEILITKVVDSICVEFQFEKFIYLDPFYGETETSNNFDTFFETIANEKRILITQILELENQFYNFEDNPLTGQFSNSIDLKIQYCKFGIIKNKQIEFEMKFYLTNSDSYGMMNGTEKDHSSLTKVVNINLDIQNLRVETRKTNDDYFIGNFIDNRVYNIDKIEKVDEINWNNYRKYYEVPVREEKIQ